MEEEVEVEVELRMLATCDWSLRLASCVVHLASCILLLAATTTVQLFYTASLSRLSWPCDNLCRRATKGPFPPARVTSLNEHDPLQGELRRERSIFIIDAVVRGTASPKTSCFSSDHPSRLLGPAQQPLQKESHVADLSPQIAWPLSLSTIFARMAGGNNVVCQGQLLLRSPRPFAGRDLQSLCVLFLTVHSGGWARSASIAEGTRMLRTISPDRVVSLR